MSGFATVPTTPGLLDDSGTGARRVRFDRSLGALAIKVDQADFYVTSEPHQYLATILGSCIAVCIRDPVILCGGMSHFALPEETGTPDATPGLQLRYGAFSIERLINALAARGALRQRLEVKVFGGANVIESGAKIGYRNSDFVESYFEREGIAIAARHLRGQSGRKVRYFPTTGRVQMKLLASALAPKIARHESEIERRVADASPAGRTTIFR